MNRKKILMEVGVMLIGLVAGLRLLALVNLPVVQEYYGFWLAAILIYLPLAVLRIRRRGACGRQACGRQIRFVENSWREAGQGIGHYLRWALLIFPLFVLAAGGWFSHVIGWKFAGVAGPPAWEYLVYQVVVVAAAEEFFFRGYVQTSLAEVWPNRWRIFGADLGPAWLVTAAVFAMFHSVVVFEGWHAAIFFPALMFGYLRARTGGLVAPILFHATSNIVLDWVLRSFG